MCSIASPSPLRQVHNSTTAPYGSPADRHAVSPKGDPSPGHQYNFAAFEALLFRIEEKELRRELRKSTKKGRRPAPSPGPPGGCGEGSTPLVKNSISRRRSLGSLPLRFIVPSYPTTFYQVYEQDVYVCRGTPDAPPAEQERGLRGKIFGLSDKSRSRLRHVCNNSGHLVKSQFLLTYHEAWPIDGTETKRHLSAWLKAVQRIIPGTLYLWVLEFQTKRGAPHFHVFLTCPPNPHHRERLARAWVKITRGTEKQFAFHNHSKCWIEWKMTDSSYLMKQYAAKAEQKDVPAGYYNVGRFWGHSRGFEPVPKMTVEPAAVARISYQGCIRWNEESVKRFIDRTLRRYHERCQNFDRKTGERRTKRWKRSKIICGRSQVSGVFRVPFGAKLMVQLMNYFAEYGPDDWAIARRHEDEIPF